MGDAVQEKVLILGKEFTVACPPEERDALRESARLLDRRMREIKESGKVIGAERIAVMAALNIAHELIRERTADSGYTRSHGERLRAIRNKIEMVLEEEDPQLRL